MSANAQAAGRYYLRKNNRLNSAFSVATATFSTNPSNGDTIHLNGVLVTFGTDVAIGSTTAATLASLVTYIDNLNNAATNVLLLVVTGGNVLNVYSSVVNANPTISVTASRSDRRACIYCRCDNPQPNSAAMIGGHHGCASTKDHSEGERDGVSHDENSRARSNQPSAFAERRRLRREFRFCQSVEHTAGTGCALATRAELERQR